MKIIILFLCITFLSVNYVYSQNHKLDSLKIELMKFGDDTNKVKLLSDLAFEFYLVGSETGIEFANNGIVLAEKLKFKAGLASCYNNLGLCLINKSEYKKSQEYFNKAMRINIEIGNRKNYATNLGNIGIIYENQSNDSLALDYYFRALNIAEEINDKKSISRHLGNIGNIYKDQSKHQKAVEYFLKAIKIEEELGQKNQIALYLGKIGLVYKNQSNYSKALEYYFKALKIDEALGDKSGIVRRFSNIGVLYKNMTDYEKALDYYFKALKIEEETGSKPDGGLIENIGVVYDLQMNYVKAMVYYTKALKINEEAKNKKGIAIDLANIGILNYELGKYPEAIEYLNKSLKYNEEIKRKIGVMICLGNLGASYLKMATNEKNGEITINKSIPKGQSDIYLKNACQNLLNAIEIGREIKSEKNLIEYYSNLSVLYKVQNNWQKAYLYAESSRILKDSVFSNENQKKIDNLESNFKMEKKEKENEILTLEVSKQTTIRNYLIVITVLILLIVAGLWNRYIIRKKQNLVLFEKNDQLNKANNDLNVANIEIDRSYKEKLQLQQEFHDKEAEIMALKNEMLQGELEQKHKELTAMAISLVDKNEYLFKLKEQAEEIGKAKPDDVGPLVRMIIRSININARSEESWQVFETQFKAIHRGFMEFISEQYPDLTVMELKVCALLKINLSSKEIGSILNISFRTVEGHRSNIRKKLELDNEMNLNQFFAHLNYNSRK